MSGCSKNIDVNHTPGRNIGIQGISGYWRMEKKGQLDFFLRGKPRFVKKQFKLPLESVDGVDMIGAKVKASSPWQQFLDFWKTKDI